MKHVLVANSPDEKTRAFNLGKMLLAQLDNFQRLCLSDDMIIVSSRPLQLEEGLAKVFVCDLNKICLTGSKVFGLQWIFQNTDIDDIFWLHDLDAWQNHPFYPPEFESAAFSPYSRLSKINGGSQFWKRDGAKLLDSICSEILKKSSNKEEPVIQNLCYGRDDVTILNSTFNVGCSGYVERFQSAIKPILVSHLHPTNRIAWQTHRLDRDGRGYVSVSKGLELVLRRHYDLADELDEEGRKAQKRKIEAQKT